MLPLLALLLTALAPAREETVLSVGPGTPLGEIAALARHARAKHPAKDLVIELAGGTYLLSQPLVLGPDDGGGPDSTTRWRAAAGESVTWSGGRVVEWRGDADGTWSAPAPEGALRQLFVDGVRRPRARWPRAGWLRVETPGDDGRTAFTYAAGDLASWPDVAGAELLFLHDWSMSRVRIARVVEESRRVDLAEAIGGYLPFFHITGFEAHPRYALENLRAGWEEPGEWYVDAETERLRYRPLPGEDPERTRAIVPLLERLLEIRGTPGKSVRGLSFEGITFAHTRSMDPVGGYAGIQAAFHDGRVEPEREKELPPESAVRVTHADNVVFRDCRFEALGASGLWLGADVRDSSVARCVFADIGACGLLIGEPTEPATEVELTAAIACEDSTFERCGTLYYGAVGIWIGIARDVTVRHNELRDLPYTGISLGWIWDPRPSPSRGHVIERNHIHHVMQTLSDGGGIYTLGRQPDTFLRHNLIHDVPVNAGRAGSNGFFIDQGSCAMVFEGNVIHSIARSPIRFHMAGANTLSNNVLVTLAATPAYRYDACAADVMTFEANRVVSPADWSRAAVAALGAGPR